MPQRWRVLLTSLLAFVACSAGAALTLFSVPQRLEWPLGLALLGASILAGWNLYRWLSASRPTLGPSPTTTKRRPLGFWRQLPWFCLQVAVIGAGAWAWANDEGPDRPSLGLVLFLATVLAVALTALPFILKEFTVGQWRLWREPRPKPQEPGRAAAPVDGASGGTG